MRALKRLLLRLARHVPTDVLRRFGRWMLGGRRRRVVRDHLFRLLGDAPRTIDRGVGAGIRISSMASNLAYATAIRDVLDPLRYRLERIEGDSGGMPHPLAVPRSW